MATTIYSIRRRLERIVKDATKNGITLFVNNDSGFMIVPTELYDATEDLRTLSSMDVDVESVSFDYCGTAVLPDKDSSGNG
jgi:hypothetical protein